MPVRKELPQLKPAAQPKDEQPVATKPKRRIPWHLSLVALIACVLALAYFLNPRSGDRPAILEETPGLSAPNPVPAAPIMAAIVDPSPRQPRPGPLAVSEIVTDPEIAAANDLPAPLPTEITLDSIDATMRPQPNPRDDASVSRRDPQDGLLPEQRPADGNGLVNLRVSVNVPGSTRTADVNALVGSLEARGISVTPPRFFDFRIATTQVRYFHESDRDDALALAEAVGGTVRDFTSFSPLPAENFVELWIAGGSPERRREASGTVLNGVQDDLRAFRESLREALRNSR